MARGERGRWQSLGELLADRAAEKGGDLLYSFLEGGNDEPRELTYAGLFAGALAVSDRIRDVIAPGDRALLLYPPGLDYIMGFWGAILAGAVAVPAYPPDPARLARTAPRLDAILKDAGARTILSTAPIVSLATAIQQASPLLGDCRWVATDGLGSASAGSPAAASADDVAFLQYTSGSTGRPKGVVLSHANLLHNSALIASAFQVTANDRAAIWLPPYHDMGLIGGILQPLYSGMSAVLMSPLSFLERPARWLAMIAGHRATISGGPNFAFDLCVRKTKESERAQFDLTSWRVAFSGAEPVRAETIDRFSTAFAGSGFRRNAFFPCYGLAEATLMVAGGVPGQGARVLARPEARPLVSVGRPLPTFSVRIMDPETKQPCPEGASGEIWLAGPSIAKGYWNNPELSSAMFEATIAGETGRFLRTGDVGFTAGGELYVSGRCKDLIIVRGKNHYPEDIERTAQDHHPALRPGCGAAFAVQQGGEERAVLVQEADATRAGGESRSEGGPVTDLSRLARQIRVAVAAAHDLSLAAVVLVSPGSVPKTSSGKIQRFACRDAFLNHQLSVVGEWREEVADEAPRRPEEPFSRPEGAPPSDPHEPWLLGAVAALCRVSPGEVDLDASLAALGMDSVAAVSLRADIEDRFGISVPLATLLGEGSLRSVLARLQAPADLPARQEEPTHPAADQVSNRCRLSRGQQALWALYQRDRRSAAFNIARAIELDGGLDCVAFGQAVCRLADQHPILKSRFEVDDAGVWQRFDAAPPVVRLVDARDWSTARVAAHLSAAALEAFDLERSGPVRVEILDRERPIVLFVVHHIVVDLWSMSLLVPDLAEHYLAACRADPSRQSSGGPAYELFVRWQSEILDGASGNDLREFWTQELAGIPEPVRLPTRTAGENSAGPIRFAFSLGTDLSGQIARAARREGVTTFAVLLSGLGVALRRYSGSEEVVIAVPSTGRELPAFRKVVGYFANSLPIRLNLSGNPAGRDLLRRTRDSLTNALAHQALPFADITQLARAATAGSGENPLTEILFGFQELGPPLGELMAPLALNVAGQGVALGNLTGRVVEVPPTSVGFPVVISAARTAGDLSLTIEVDGAVHDAATIEALKESWIAAVRELCQAPATPLRKIASLGRVEQETLRRWADGPAPDAGDLTVVEMVRRWAEREPRRPAVVAADGTVDYGTLDLRVSALASALTDAGVGPDDVVTVCVDRTSSLLVALLGVLRCGAAYLPLDPATPAERGDFILTDAGSSIVLGSRAACETLRLGRRVFVDVDAQPPGGGGHEDRGTPGPTSLAYVIYTSGSTGRPKGVEVSRGALANLLASMAQVPGLRTAERFLAVTTVSFDIAALELFVPLMVGGTVVLASREEAQNGQSLVDLIERSGASAMQATPSTWRLLLKTDWRPPSRFVGLCGGEGLPPELATLLVERGIELYNMYGPTETTVWSTFARVTSPSVTVGRPIHGTTAVILDESLDPLPIGAVGELYIGGRGVARGYRGRPALTAEHFLPSPFSRGERLYRTGDRARYRRDGSIEVLGRRDHQIKLRGYRIELPEIEAVLNESPAVHQVVAVTVGEDDQSRRLVACVTMSAAGTVDEVAAHARRLLPEYMVPSAIVPMAQLPTLPNGKVDRVALQQLASRASVPSAQAEPRTETERVLLKIWRTLLRREDVGTEDDFFHVGGHSLLAMEVAAAVRRTLGAVLPVDAIFKARTVTSLAALIVKAAGDLGGDPSGGPIAHATQRRDAPLSYAQRRMWLLSELYPGAAYHLPAAYRLRGPLVMPAFAASVDGVLRRHQALRTIFKKDSAPEPRQSIGEACPTLRVVAVEGSTPADALARALTWANREISRPFDLTEGPLARVTLLRLGDRDHLLVAVLHHVVADGESLALLVRQVEAEYAAQLQGSSAPFQAAPVTHLDHAAWERASYDQGRTALQLDYWRAQLEGCAPLRLPADRMPSAAATLAGASLTSDLGPQALHLCETLASRLQATPFMTLLAAFKALLYRYSGQTDLCVGIPVSGRRSADIGPLVGLFVNTVAIRTHLSGAMTFDELVASVRDTTLAALRNGDVPFDRVVEAVSPTRAASTSPIFQVSFAMEREADLALTLPDLQTERLAVECPAAKFDIALTASTGEGGLTLRWEYRTDLFDASTIQRMAGHFEALLRDAARHPDGPVDELEMLSADERRRLLREWAEAGGALPESGCIHDLVSDWAKRVPNVPAVMGERESLTYEQLDQASTSVARALLRRGVRPEQIVAVCLQRSPQLIIAMLGILKAGAAYAALDPTHPPERLAQMLDESDAALVLSQGTLAERLEKTGRDVLLLESVAAAPAAPEARPALVSSDQLAYVIHTSGSTGTPKGVGITHRGVLRLVLGTCGVVGPGDRVAQVSATSFDAAPYEIWGALCRGATLVIIDGDDVVSPAKLEAKLDEHRVTSILLTTALFNMVVRERPAAVRLVRHLFFGGEAADAGAVQALLADGGPVNLIHAYGPAENTTIATTATITSLAPSQNVPIGRPVSNTTALVLDRAMRPVPVGVVGELFLGGEGLARGYLRRPAFTAERFVPDPYGRHPGKRLYRTGDLVRWRADGELEFVGRDDDQVKIRGFRVEPGEVANLLAADPAVKQVAVIGGRDPVRGGYLTAYLTLQDSDADVAEITARLRRKVPEFMVPAAMVVLPSLPLTVHGKVDVGRLPAAELGRTENIERPRTELERTVAKIIGEVLGSDGVGLDQSFFDLGGHSLLAAQVASRLSAVLRKDVSIRHVIEAETVRRLAANLDSVPGDAPASTITRAPRRVMKRRQAGRGDRE